MLTTIDEEVCPDLLLQDYCSLSIRSGLGNVSSEVERWEDALHGGPVLHCDLHWSATVE